MSENEKEEKTVAPGYPAIETLKGLDVSEWEPAAVFRPVVLRDEQEKRQ